MTAWLLAALIQNAQAQNLVTLDQYPTHYRATVSYMNGSINAAQSTVMQNTFPTTSHKLSRGFSADHSGIDIDGNIGDPVLAWQNGIVETVSQAGPYGNKIIIRHNDMTTSVYAHLDTITVTPGEPILSGASIGTLGTSGNSTGSHLHFEIRHNDNPIDAWPFIQ